jgi:hypothetical protein
VYYSSFLTDPALNLECTASVGRGYSPGLCGCAAVVSKRGVPVAILAVSENNTKGVCPFALKDYSGLAAALGEAWSVLNLARNCLGADALFKDAFIAVCRR